MTIFHRTRCCAKSRYWGRDHAVRIFGLLTFASLEAVRNRWAAQRIEDATKSSEALMALEINECDLVKIFGAKIARAIWPIYSKPLQKALSGSITNYPGYQQAKLVDVHVGPATSRHTGDVSREVIAMLPADNDYFSADVVYDRATLGKTKSQYGHYLIIDGRAKHLVAPDRLLKAYRRYQFFDSD